MVLPRTTSERREFLTIGILKKECVVTDAAQVIYDPPLYVLSILSSRLHMIWVKAIAGRLKMDPRYSNTLCYNVFPFPVLNPDIKASLEDATRKILLAREESPGMTLAERYDPEKMPLELREAHRLNDLTVERCYRPEPFESDDERLVWLFRLYEEMIAAEREKDSLFAATKKAGKGRGRTKK
jgi:hypothetical protein